MADFIDAPRIWRDDVLWETIRRLIVRVMDGPIPPRLAEAIDAVLQTRAQLDGDALDRWTPLEICDALIGFWTRERAAVAATLGEPERHSAVDPVPANSRSPSTRV